MISTGEMILAGLALLGAIVAIIGMIYGMYLIVQVWREL